MIFVKSSNDPGVPAFERVFAFESYFRRRGKECVVLPVSELNSLNAVRKISKDGSIFLSMPPFRKWWLFLVPGLKIILDIRDGWSIAIASGYGDTSPKKLVKAFFARQFEKFAIRRAFITITCTPGLKFHLERVSGRKIFIIPNGISDNDYALANNLRASLKKNELERGVVKLCCAGKFSEYGNEKVKEIISTINDRYSDRGYIIRLFGSDKINNAWTKPYVEKISLGRGKVEIIDRLSRPDLYEQMSYCDVGVSVIRDPQYDFGTKVFDYIALGLPVLNYFSKPNPFTDYFNRYLDEPFEGRVENREILRSEQIEEVLSGVAGL